MPLTKPPKQKIQKVGFLTKNKVAKKIKNLPKIIALLKKHNKEVYFDKYIGKKLKSKEIYTRSEILGMCDLVIVFGGDGTILKTAGFMQRKRVFILSVNYGTLGFLSEAHPDKLEERLKKVLKGDFMIDRRSLLRVTHYRNNKKQRTFLAMNDAVINQGVFARLIELDIDIDGTHMVSFKADGMIIATPTGSSAHSLSAGGPIIHPALNALVFTPICPAPLTLRPIVISNDREATIKIITQRRDDTYNLGLTVDGQVTVSLKYGDIIKTRRSSRYFYMIRFEGSDYYQNLRKKLGWGERPIC